MPWPCVGAPSRHTPWTGSQGVRGSNPLSSTHETPGKGLIFLFLVTVAEAIFLVFSWSKRCDTPTPGLRGVAGDTSTHPLVRIIVYDAPGNDVEYNDSEYVVLRNDGTGTADVGGWWLVDLADHQITLPAGYSIPPGGTLRVYAGPGDSKTTRYFAGRGQAI